MADRSGVDPAAQIDLLRRGYAAVRRGDVETLREVMHPDVEFHNPPDAVEPGIRRGFDAFTSVLTGLADTFGDMTYEPEQFVVEGDRVICAVRVRAQGKASGVPIDQWFSHVWTMRDGKATKLEWHMGLDVVTEARDRQRTGGNAELLEQGYAALQRGDLDAMLAMLDPEVEIRDRPESPDAGVYHGREGTLGALGLNEEAFESFELAPERFVEIGSHVVVVLMLRVRGRESGIPVEERIAHLWSLRKGRATRMQVYTSPDDAIAEALRIEASIGEDEGEGRQEVSRDDG